MLKTEAITKFLYSQPYKMCRLYTPEMEVQVNVARGDGEPITDIHEGVRWQGFTDGSQTWKHFRIPWNASKDPQYIDKDINFDISVHAEAIGMTGWNWYRKQSLWVGFDFDSIINHKAGLTNDELEDIKKAFSDLPYVSLISSTSGVGLHIYIFVTPTDTTTHTEHAAVARALLNKISISTGLALEAKVDCMGSNMWVWHRKAIPDKSYLLIKQHSILCDVPKNWQDYLPRVSRRNYTPRKQSDIEQLTNSNYKQKLNDEHVRVLNWFESGNSQWWWDDQRQMLICHTSDLKRAHDELKLRGIFETIATGRGGDTGRGDHNCFAIPLSSGGWQVYRYTRGTQEHAYWYVNNSGWTTCRYNAQPSYSTALKTSGGVEREKDYYFKTIAACQKAIQVLGIDFDIPTNTENRPAFVKRVKGDRICVSFPELQHDPDFHEQGWIKTKKEWQQYFFLPKVNDEIDLPDHVVRHVVNNNIDFGWLIKVGDNWNEEPKGNVIDALKKAGYKQQDELLGQCILNPWRLVSIPFEGEYPGNREWNRLAAQFRFNPERGPHRSWDLVLNHCGDTLTPSINNHSWCKDHAITNGGMYLLCWIACLLQKPSDPLPYLFLYGPQNCGKSILHEALNLLVTGGVVRADNALINNNGFNAELLSAILCVVEETNLSKKNLALDRIKDWVTGRSITIHAKGKTPYDIPNVSHWIQCANNISFCPVFPGDTRITVVRVNDLTAEIPKNKLLAQLEDEAPAFLNSVLTFEIPDPIGRLRLPVIETTEKFDQMEFNKSALHTFVEERTYIISGHVILFSELYDHFIAYLSPDERSTWSNRKTAKELRELLPQCPIGRYSGSGSMYVGNISFTKDKTPDKPFTKIGERICQG